jgi:hypothetical protein
LYTVYCCSSASYILILQNSNQTDTRDETPDATDSTDKTSTNTIPEVTSNEGDTPTEKALNGESIDEVAAEVTQLKLEEPLESTTDEQVGPCILNKHCRFMAALQ